MVEGPGFVCWQVQEFLLENVLTRSGAHPALYLVGTGVIPTRS